MKKIFICMKILVFLALVWNTGVPEWVCAHWSDSDRVAANMTIRTDSLTYLVNQRWASFVAREDAIARQGGRVYGPWQYFSDLCEIKGVFGERGFGLCLAQEELFGRFVRNDRSGNFTRAEIDEARDSYFPPDPHEVPWSWWDIFQAILQWLLDQYLFGLPWACLLFGIWFRENPFFEKFTKNPVRGFLSLLLWPLVMWMVLKDKFEDHFYSTIAEAMVRRTKQSFSGALTRAEKLLVKELTVKKIGLFRGRNILLSKGFVFRHGFCIVLLFVCMRSFAQTTNVSIAKSSLIENAQLYKPPPDYGVCGIIFSLAPPEEGLLQRQKIFFHYMGRALSAHVRLLDPIPWGLCSNSLQDIFVHKIQLKNEKNIIGCSIGCCSRVLCSRSHFWAGNAR